MQQMQELHAPPETYGGPLPRAVIAYRSQALQLHHEWHMQLLVLLAYLAMFLVYQVGP